MSGWFNFYDFRLFWIFNRFPVIFANNKENYDAFDISYQQKISLQSHSFAVLTFVHHFKPKVSHRISTTRTACDFWAETSCKAQEGRVDITALTVCWRHHSTRFDRQCIDGRAGFAFASTQASKRPSRHSRKGRGRALTRAS